MLSTPLENVEITEDDLNNIYDYIGDTANYLEVTLESTDTNIYQNAHENVEKNIAQIFTTPQIDKDIIKIIGGSNGGYGNILKKINALITPVDPVKNHIENK